MSLRRAGVLAVAASALLLAGCLPGPAASGPTASGPLARFESQQVAWAPCGTYECASVDVPLDYAAPEGRTISLGVTRQRATREPRLGTLFVNPGGPGGSGRDMVRFFGTVGLERFDLVGWDPRGVGASAPVTCLDGPAADAHLQLDASPDTPEEFVELREGARRFGASCLAGTGADLLAHVSTVETVRDLDVLRAVVGDPRLHFLGVSYGTQIGALYAELFPQRVGRLVLDAAVDVNDTRQVPQSLGFDRALGNFAVWCARQRCGLGDTPEAVVAGLRADLDALDARPLAVRDRTLTQTLAVTGIAASLYSGEDAWPLLAHGVRVLREGDGLALLTLADELNSRRPDGTYGGLFSSFPAITCLDRPGLDAAAADRQWEADRARAPFFGTYLGPWYTCSAWPVPPDPIPPIRGEGAAPILVVGATGDPATPYEWSVAAADALASGVLLTYDGEGHGAYGGRSACVDSAVRAWLTDGVLPPAGSRCS